MGDRAVGVALGEVAARRSRSERMGDSADGCRGDDSAGASGTGWDAGWDAGCAGIKLLGDESGRPLGSVVMERTVRPMGRTTGRGARISGSSERVVRA